MASQSDRIEKEVPKYFTFQIRSDRIDLKFEVGGVFNLLAWHVPTGPTSPRQSIAVWALSTTTNEAINREPQRVATGATAAPTDTDHSTACPGGGSSKKVMAVGSTIFPSTRSAKRDENQARREPSDRPSFLACAAKKNRGCRRRARDDARRRSHLLSSVLVSRVLCDMLLFPIS